MKSKKEAFYKGLTIFSVLVLGGFGHHTINTGKFRRFLKEETVTLQVSPVLLNEAEEKPKVALTFDDGPSEQTELLLEGLRTRNVRATFFVVGEKIQDYEEVMKQMVRDGNIVGNHSYSHKQLNHVSEKTLREEIDKTNEVLRKLTGESPVYLRPPYGEWKKEREEEFDMIPVFWDVDSLDWKLQDTQKIVTGVLDQVEDGDIILMHDGYETSTKAVMVIIDSLKKEGYEFVTVEDMIFP